MSAELLNNGHYVCISFSDQVDNSSSDDVQSNQFLIVTRAWRAHDEYGGIFIL